VHYYSFENILPDIIIELPKISFSFLNLVENLPILHDLQLLGHILPNGGFISYDGKFFVYNTNCKLVIAQDIKNRNFTIIGNYKNGQLKVLSLVDRLTTVEITDNGIAKLNGKIVKWPIIVGETVMGLKQWNSYTIRSRDSCVEIICSDGLKSCQVSINYVFTGYIRGILGNGNGEIYDDFILPDGNLAETEDTFFNAYGIGACGAQIAMASAQSDNCLSLFAWNSPMSYAFNIVSPNAFKKMCDVYTRCEVAFTYASATILRHIPVIVPADCLKCEEKKKFGDEYSIKIPTNKADIIFVVDLDVSKEVIHDLVLPTISEIQNDLKDRNFNDVNMGIIGYSTKYSEPLIISGGLENVDLQHLLNKLIQSLYPRVDEKAFELAMRYPFRPLATKTIIVIRSDGLVLNLGNVGRAILYSAAAELQGILLQVVHPVSGLSDEVIGFNNKLVAPLRGPKDAKRRHQLKYESNVGIGNVLQSGGWVFDLNKFNALLNEDDRKSFVHQLTSAIAENLFRTEITGNCRCITFDGLTGSTSCVVVKSVNTTKKIKNVGNR